MHGSFLSLNLHKEIEDEFAIAMVCNFGL